MTFYKLSALLVIIGLCTYALLLFTRPLSQANELTPDIDAEKMSSTSAQTRLFFSPSVRQLTAGVNNVPLMIATGMNTIDFAQIEMEYNPALLTVSSVQSGTMLIDPVFTIESNNTETGTLHVVLNQSPEVPPVSGTGELLMLNITPNMIASRSSTTSIRFRKRTAVRGPQQDQSLLQSTEDLVLKLPFSTE